MTPKLPALEVSHLTVMYRNTVILSDCTLNIPQGVMLGIIGPNGAGKTTFIKSILGFIPIVSGKITILGQIIHQVRNKITYIPQRSSIDWDFPVTVFDMVLMGCYGTLGWLKRPDKDEYQKVYEVLTMVGLEIHAHTPIGALSGGQQQRAFLARSLMQNADIYFLDEPFIGVDITTEKILIQLFKQLCAQGKTIIVVHHDLPTAPIYFD